MRVIKARGWEEKGEKNHVFRGNRPIPLDKMKMRPYILSKLGVLNNKQEVHNYEEDVGDGIGGVF